MQIAIVGLASAGKTTVFNTLTRGHAETGGYGGLTVNVGVVKVPDERLTRLTALFHPKREVPADVTYVDLPAPPSASEGHGGANDLPADQLARLRNADALLHVVRAFDDPSVPHADGAVDPWGDLERLELEFTLADLGGGREARGAAAGHRAPRHAGRARGQRPRAGGAGAHRARPAARARRSAPSTSTTRRPASSAASVS